MGATDPNGEKITKHERAALAQIAKLDDAGRLRNLLKNARANGSSIVESAAFQRLCEVQPAAKSGTLEHDVWRSIHALEEMKKSARGKTVLLNRTRQKIKRDGEAKTVADLTMKSEPSAGFRDLVEMGHPELLFEAVVLRHPDVFDDDVQQAATERLKEANIDISHVTTFNGEQTHG